MVPMHRPIKPGTLKGLIEQAGVTVEEFVKELQYAAGYCGRLFGNVSEIPLDPALNPGACPVSPRVVV